MPVLLGRAVTVLPTVPVLVKCTQCYRIVRLTGEEQVDEDGERYVDAIPVYRAMALHMTYGCTARRREE